MCDVKLCECKGNLRTVLVVADGLWKCPRCGGLIVGHKEKAGEVARQLAADLGSALHVMRECDKYLDSNKLNTIGTRSTLHFMIKEELKKADDRQSQNDAEDEAHED